MEATSIGETLRKCIGDKSDMNNLTECHKMIRQHRMIEKDVDRFVKACNKEKMKFSDLDEEVQMKLCINTSFGFLCSVTFY